MSFSSPKIIFFHGFMAREHMQRHWLKYAQELGFTDVHLHGHMASASQLAQHIQQTRAAGQKLVLFGYSQGGFQAVKVARALQAQDQAVDLLVSIAAGGKGRLLPTQWGFNSRSIPANVHCAWNFFALGDRLGTDDDFQQNLIYATSKTQQIDNIYFAKDEAVDHIGISRCYPKQRIIPAVQSRLIDRVSSALLQAAASK